MSVVPAAHLRIALDAMGGDLGPAEVVEGVRLARKAVENLEPVVLVGDETVLRPLVERAGLDRTGDVSILHTSEVITMDDKPLTALKKKRDASMVRAIELLKSGEARVLVSCGNTGALMAGGTLRLRTMEGIERPALAAVIPQQHGYFVMLDVGANPESRPEHLAHNAILGKHYCRVVLGIEHPRIGLLSIGTEEGKGNETVNTAHEYLRRISHLTGYIGRIEGFQVFEGAADVVVCDGFTGNILLKSWESFAIFFKEALRREMRRTPMRMAGAALARNAFAAVKHRMNADRYSGAPLLGLRGNILKAHGSSNRHAFAAALGVASEIIHCDMNHLIEADIARANEVIHPLSV